MEKRLHRVKITLNKKNVTCPFAKECSFAESCCRCNQFYEKCTNFKLLKRWISSFLGLRNYFRLDF